MRRRRAYSPVEVSMAAGLGLVAGLGLWLGLSALATPSHLNTRLAEAERSADQAAGILAKAHGAGAYPPGALCRRAAGTGADRLRQALQAAGARQGVTLAGLAATPGAGDEALGGLTSVAYSFEAKGRYDQVVGLMRDLAAERPQLFIDRSDLQSQAGAVSLKLSGRIYCSTSARL